MLQRLGLSLADFPRHDNLRFGPEDISWIFTGQHAILDNFALLAIKVDVGYGLHRYDTSEHAFAAAKASNRTRHDYIADADNPGTAKYRGRATRLRKDWEEVKFDVMWQALRAKFTQHPSAAAALIATHDRQIYEGNTWADDIWGVIEVDRSGLYTGHNALGVMLMTVRGKLLKGEPL